MASCGGEARKEKQGITVNQSGSDECKEHGGRILYRRECLYMPTRRDVLYVEWRSLVIYARDNIKDLLKKVFTEDLEMLIGRLPFFADRSWIRFWTCIACICEGSVCVVKCCHECSAPSLHSRRIMELAYRVCIYHGLELIIYLRIQYCMYPVVGSGECCSALCSFDFLFLYVSSGSLAFRMLCLFVSPGSLDSAQFSTCSSYVLCI